MSELLLKKDVTREEFLEVVQKIHMKTVQAMEFLETTLTWTRSNFDSIKVNKENICICTLVAPVLELYKTAMDNKRIKVSLDVSDQLQFFTDKEITIVIIRNLISNAIKYTPHEGKILVRAFTDNEENKIMVSDTGVGMTHDTIKALLGDSSYYSQYGTHQEKGLGIGLHLCRELLGRLGGRMTIESTLNKGSTFTIHLPKT